MKDIIAAFMFFMRLPLWRIYSVPADSFKHIVAYWPLTGIITGALMATVYLLAIYLNFHAIIAVILAFVSRLLLTGALHEDGLADFFDGFGGGRSREQVLMIMKDSHIGSYGVLGLIVYTLLWIGCMFSLVQVFRGDEFILFLTCDIWSKWCASQVINILPYARNEEESKIKKVYDRMSPARFILGFMFGAIPFIYLIIVSIYNTAASYFIGTIIIVVSAIVPLIIMALIVLYIKRRINGYTGDCCGAIFLLCELSYLLILNCLCKL